MTIFLGRTSKEKFDSETDFIPISELTPVYQGRLTIQNGWNRFEFNIVDYFDYDISDNLVVAVSTDLIRDDGILAPTGFTMTTTSENTCVVAYTDEWREMPTPSYYDGHWEEFPVAGQRWLETHNWRPNIDLCTYCCKLRTGEFDYSATEAEYAIGMPFNAPVFTNENGGTVEFSSSDPTVAQVQPDGTVVMQEHTGEAIITALLPADATYCTNSAQYIIRARQYATLTYQTSTSTCSGTASEPPAQQTGLATVTLSNNVPTCDEANKVFVEWNTKEDGTGDAYYPNGSFPLLSDTTLYAIYGSPCCVADSALLVTYTRDGVRDTAHRSPDGYYNFDICQHQALTVKVEPREGCSYLENTAKYEFRYANHYMPVEVNGSNFTPPSPYSLTFDSVVGYDLNFTASTGSCLLTMPGRVRVSDGIGVAWWSDEPFLICPGVPTDISVGYLKDENDYVRVDRSQPATTATMGHTETIFLPDGIDCGEGCAYTSSVSFYQFEDYDLEHSRGYVKSKNDIKYLKINMEHSWLGDLFIKLTCPPDPTTGVRRSVAVMKYSNGSLNSGSGSSSCLVGISEDMKGWEGTNYKYNSSGVATGINSWGNNKRDAQLGKTIDPYDGGKTDDFVCDDSKNDNRPGIGWDYVWSSATNQNYQWANETKKVYHTSNIHSGRSADNKSVYIVDSSKLATRKQIYKPDQGFEELVGCPLNGEWTVTVQDGWKYDNGWLFSWELSLSEDHLRHVWSYTTELDSTWAACDWTGSKYNDHFTLTPPASFTGGTINCDVTTEDNFGCRRTKNIPFNFVVKNLILAITDSLANCDGDGGKIAIEIPPTNTGEQPFSFTLDPYDPIDPMDPHGEQGPSTSRRFRDVEAGSHQVLVVDKDGCWRKEQVNIGINEITGTLASYHNAICDGEANGDFTVTATTTQTVDGNVFTFAAPGLDTNTTGVFTSVPAGNYQVIITDTYGSCSDTVDVPITSTVPAITLVGDTLVQPTQNLGCPLPAGEDYVITATIEGTGPFTHEWHSDHSFVSKTSSGTTATARIRSTGACDSFTDTLIVTETTHNCTARFPSSFITVASTPSIALATGVEADKDWGCDATHERFEPTAANFVVTDACNLSATATVTHGTEEVNGCHHSNWWAASYTNSCGTSATPDTIKHAWLVTDKPTFSAMPIVTAVAKNGDCKYLIPDLKDTVLPRTSGCENSSLCVIEQTPASLAEYLQRADRNDTIDVTVVVRDTCGDTAHAHVQVIIPQNKLTIATNLSTTSNTIDTSACNGYGVSTTVTVNNPSGTAHSVWTSTPAGFSSTDPTYPLSLKPGTPDTTYQVVVTDGNGCTDTAKVHISLNPDPVLSQATGSGDYEQDVCLGQSITPIKVKLENSTYDPTSEIASASGISVVVNHHDDAPDTLIISGTPTATGSYAVNAISNQSPVCDSKNITVTFNVTDTIVPVIVTEVGGVANRDTVCITSATSLTDTVMIIRETAGESGDSWSWTVDGGSIISGNDTREITVKWTSDGDKTVTVTVTHSTLNCTSVKSKHIHVQAVPTLDMGSYAGGGDEVTICPNRDTLSFTAAVSGAVQPGGYTYQFGGQLDFGTSPNGTNSDTAAVPFACGVDYRVGVTATDNRGCSVTDSMTVHAVDVTAPTFTTPTSTHVLAPVTVTGCDLSALTTAHPTVQTAAGLLDTLNVTVSDGCTPVSQLSLSHRDSVMTNGVTCGNKIRRYYVVTDLCGNKDSIYEEIYVQFPSTKPTVDAIAAVTATPKDSDCKYVIPDLSATVLANAHGNCSDAYLRIIEQSPAALTEYLQNPLKNDTIDVMIAVKDTCSDSAQVHVQVVIPQNKLTISTNLSANSNIIDTSACAGYSVATTVTVNNPSGTAHSVWTSTPVGFSSTDPTYPLSLNPSTPDTTYQVVVTDGNGCTDTAKVHIVLNPDPVISQATGSGDYEQSICLGESITPIKIKLENSYLEANTITDGGVTVDVHHHDNAPDTLIISGHPSDTASYVLNVLSDQSPVCDAKSVTVTFNVADTVVPVIVTEVGGVSGKDTVCISSTTSLTNSEMTISETAAMTGETYVWTVDGGTITSGAGTRVITVAWTTSGDKTVTVSVTRGSCTSVKSKVIYVQTVPTPTLTNAAASSYDLATDTYPICPNRDTLSFNTTLGGSDPSATYTYTYGGQLDFGVSPNGTTSDTASIPHNCGVNYRVGVTVMDNHGCSVTDSMTISAVDTTAPTVLTAGGTHVMDEVNLDGCTSDLTTLYPAATTPAALSAAPYSLTLADECTPINELSVSNRDSVFASVTCGYKVRRYYVVTDLCGNKDSVYQDISVHIPQHSFTISDVPTSVNIGCVDSAVGLNYSYTRIVLPTVTDGCGHTVVPVTTTPTPVTTGRTCMDTTTFTYTYQDCEAPGTGHDTTWTFTYNVTLPELSMSNPTILVDTLPCTNSALEAVSFNTPSGEMRDACGRLVTPIPVDESGNPILDGGGNPVTDASAIINVDGTGNGTVTFNWKYTDCSGREYIWQRKHVIKPAAFDGYPNDTVTVTCVGQIVTPVKPSESVCGDPVVFSDFVRDSVDTDRGCYMITYTSTYEVFAQTYTWTYAYIYNPPAFTIPADVTNTSLECIADTVPPALGDLPVVTHTGCLGIDATITPTGPVRTIKSNGCKDTVIYTYHYEDCARSGDWNYIYIIAPVTPPHELPDINTGNYAATSGAVQCFDSCYADSDTIWGAHLPVIVSVCGDTLATPTPTYADTLTDASHDNVTGTRTYHYVYTDCSGENSFEWTYRYNVSRHTNPTEVPQDPMNPTSLVDTVAHVTCDSLAVRPQLPTVVDVCGNPVAPAADSSVVRTNHHCQDTVTYYYNFYDPSYIAGVDNPANELAYHWYFRYYIDRTQMPVIVQEVNPNKDTVDCFAEAGLPTLMPVVLDACNDTLTPFDTIVDEHHDMNGGNPLCTGYVKYTFRYRDCTHTNILPWEYTRYVEHPALTIPQNDTVSYTCVNAAMNYIPSPDTLTNACGDVIVPDSIGRTSTLNAHDSGYVSYHYRYTDCDGQEYDWYYVCDVRPDVFQAPADSSRTVNCLAQASVPTTAQYPIIDDCGVRVPQDRMWDSGEYPDTTFSVDFNDTCGMVTYTYTYTIRGEQYTWSYIYTIEPPEFSFPTNVATRDTIECYDVNSPISAPTLPVVINSCGDTINSASTNAPTLVIDSSDYVAHNYCTGNIIYNYTYADCGGDTLVWSFTHVVLPTTAPYEVENPITHQFARTTENVECFVDGDTITGNDLPVIVSVCGDTLSPRLVTYADTMDNAAHDTVTGTRTYHYIYTDCAGNEFDWNFVYTVVRHTNPFQSPEVGNPPVSTEAHVNCDTLVVRPEMPRVIDVCGGVLEPYADSSIVRTNHNCKDTVIYNYNYYDPSYIPGTDDPSNELVYHWSFTYYIDKALMPTVVQGFSPDHDTVPCFDSAGRPNQTPVVVDACGVQLVPVIDSVDNHTNGDPNNCTGNRTFRYVYTDCSGMLSDTLTYTRYIVHPELIVPANDTVSYVCANAAMDYQPQPDTLTNHCGDVIVPDSISCTSYLNAHDSGYVSYLYRYTDCDGRTYDWYYVCDVRPEPFQAPADSTRDVNCVSYATRPTASQRPDIVVCGETIPFNNDSTIVYSVDYNDTCGVITYEYHYTVHGETYTWNYIYNVSAPDFTFPTVATTETVECYDVNSPAMQPTLPVVVNECGDVLSPVSMSIDSSDYVSNNSCHGNIVYTYTYTDCAGNTHDWVYTYVVHHTTLPHIVGVEPPTSGNVACFADALENFPVPTVEDVCGRPIATPTAVVTQGGTDCDGWRNYKYNFVDCDGVVFEWNFRYNVHDTVAPHIDVNALVNMGVTNSVAMGNCQYSMPDLSSATMQVTTDVASENCSGNFFFVEQSPSSLQRFMQPLTDTIIRVRLIVRDACQNRDTAYVDIVIPGSYIAMDLVSRDENGQTVQEDEMCLGQEVTLEAQASSANGEQDYIWSPTTGLTINGSTAVASPAQTTTYMVTFVDANGCSVNDTYTLTVHQPSETDITASSCDHYEWYGQSFDSSAEAEYMMTDRYGCDSLLHLHLTIHYSQATFYGDTICDGENYRFFNRTLVSTGTYEQTISSSNGCDSVITLYLLVVPRPPVHIDVEYDCNLANYTLTAQTQATAFQWRSVPSLADLEYQANNRAVTVTPDRYTHFTVLAGYEGLMQCAVSDTISLEPVSVVDATMEVTPVALYHELLDWSAVDKTKTETWRQWYVDGFFYGDESEISGVANEDNDSMVVVLIVGTEQCTDTARVVVPMLREALYVPNVFTPDLKINRKFGAVGTGITSFKMDIYNRSGALVFRTDNINEWWDGAHNGTPCEMGSYVYRIIYVTEVYPDVTHEIVGQVLLLR
ncbi:MAG: gliding motility-associated C-terminal domain-containing protein [Bacteroidales bacterium]|nr:gliding motility-associated C-terminal domain-containing protein [Bacteroidales bacterium]